MATIEFCLKQGYQVGKNCHTEVVLREPTAGDVIEANEESEKLIVIPEPMFVASPTLVGINVLRRQIVSIGSVSGPLSLAELKNLHPQDLDQIQAEANKLESAWSVEAASKEGHRRGRDHTPGANH